MQFSWPMGLLFRGHLGEGNNQAGPGVLPAKLALACVAQILPHVPFHLGHS